MIIYYAPEGQIGSLAQAFREAEAMAGVLSDPKNFHAVCDNMDAITGLLQIPPVGNLTVDVRWDEGKLVVTAMEYRKVAV